MSGRTTFPKALLKQPWEKRLEFFQECRIVHGKMASTVEDIISAIRRRAGEGFIFVVGPTRIGKTTVLEYVVKKLLEDSMEEMLNDPGCIPVGWVETRPYQRGYDWKDHWAGCLNAIREPLIEHKVEQGPPHYGNECDTRTFPREGKTAAILRRAFEEAAKHRKLRVFCLDEAQHLTLVPYSKMYRAQLEIIKSVASQSKAMHVLFGTYDLLKLRNASGQLGSRAVTTHFSRYRPDSRADLQEFAEAMLSLSALMPFKEPPDLSKALDYCFDICLGCIGLLKVWFTDALATALESGERTLTLKSLEKNAPPIDVLDKISSEIVYGEKMLEQNENRRSVIKLRMLKGSKYEEPEPSQHSLAVRQDKTDCLAESDVQGDDAQPVKSKRGQKKGRPGERSPKRDSVGGGRKKGVA
jgi:hypothetical protein